MSVILGLTLLLVPMLVHAANLLSNDGLETPFVKYDTYTDPLNRTWDLQVAQGWEKFILPWTYENGRRLRFFTASDWAAFNNSPITEKRDGSNAQVWWSSEMFDTGIYQQVSGLTIGETYGFQAGILQVFETTTSKTHNKMFRSVGIDPTGGINPASSNVVWSPEESLDVDWFYPGVGARAQAQTMTVFVRVRSIDEASTPNSNQVWVDDTFMDIAPNDTSLVLSKNSPTEVKAAWGGSPRSGFQLKGYEAQYRKATDSTWTDLQILDSSNDFSTVISATFSVEKGIEYVVRARTWHEQIGGDSHEVPGPWLEQTIALGGRVAGRVLDNRENPFGNLIVQASDAMTTTGGQDGSYALFTGVGVFTLTVSGDENWIMPQPVQAVVPNDETTLPLTITLRPTDDIIQNGDFETDNVNPWSHTATQTTFITTTQRSGKQSLCISNTVMMTQTSVISNMFQPTLSFWYKRLSGDGEDILTAELLGATPLTTTNRFTTTTIDNTWRHAWLDLNLTEVYTGPVGARFTLHQVGSAMSTICLDEISLGGAREGSKMIYLPVVVKN